MVQPKCFAYGSDSQYLIVGKAFSLKDFFSEAFNCSRLMENGWAFCFEVSRENYQRAVNSGKVRIV